MPDRSETIATAVRTLVIAGYEITGSREQSGHFELECERTLRIGARAKLLVAVSHTPTFDPSAVEAIRHTCDASGRATVLVAPEPADGVLGWSAFLAILGGAVPSWRALTDEYAPLLEKCARNERPDGYSGEVWLLLEDLVADGMEYLFGRRVARLGGKQRGKPLPDILAHTPDGQLLLGDAKAAKDGFDATDANLRPLGEYVQRQSQRQVGGPPLYAAVVVSSAFIQAAAQLASTSLTFHANYGVPVCFMPSATLLALIEATRSEATLRNVIRWRQLFRGGLVDGATAKSEIKQAQAERFSPGEI